MLDVAAIRALNSIAAELSKRRFRVRFTPVSGNSLARVRRTGFRWDALLEPATLRLADAGRFPPRRHCKKLTPRCYTKLSRSALHAGKA
jgi:hypothetical protein